MQKNTELLEVLGPSTIVQVYLSHISRLVSLSNCSRTERELLTLTYISTLAILFHMCASETYGHFLIVRLVEHNFGQETAIENHAYTFFFCWWKALVMSTL